MSKYITRMKDTLLSLNATAQKIHADMDQNNRSYLPEAAAKENTRLQAELNQAVESARERIDSIHADAAAAARAWGKLDGTKIDAADIELLKGDFQFTKAKLEDLLFKHQGNATMVNAIVKYAKEHGIVLDYVPTVEGKLSAYDAMAQSAQDMIGTIVQSIGLPNDSMTIKLWGEPGNISDRLELALYGIEQREEPKAPPRAHFNFNFTPLPGR